MLNLSAGSWMVLTAFKRHFCVLSLIVLGKGFHNPEVELRAPVARLAVRGVLLMVRGGLDQPLRVSSCNAERHVAEEAFTRHVLRRTELGADANDANDANDAMRGRATRHRLPRD